MDDADDDDDEEEENEEEENEEEDEGLGIVGQIEAIATLLQVPFVRDNIEGIWLRDTTSIIHHLETKYPDKVEKTIFIRRKLLLFKDSHLNSFLQAGSTLTGDPVADFFSLLLEDWADEYLWRPAMYYR